MKMLPLVLSAVLTASSVPASEIEAVGSSRELREQLATNEGATVLNLWATWCLPCLVEIDDLEALSREFAADRILFIGLSIDDAAASDRATTQKRVADLLIRKKITYRNLYWIGSAEPLFRELGVESGIPFTIVFDGAGREVWKHEGVINPVELAEVLRSLSPEEPLQERSSRSAREATAQP